MSEEVGGVKVLAIATIILIVFTIVLSRSHPQAQQVTTPSLSPISLESSPTATPTPVQLLPKPKNLTYTNKYFALSYPESWETKTMPANNTFITWQANTPTTTFQIIVQRARYTYQSYQYHVSTISNHPQKGEIYSSLTEQKVAGVTALSYTHTTTDGQTITTMWLAKAGLEYQLTWNRDNNQDEIESILRSLVLP